MAPIVECVPNISEGRNQQVITAIVEAINQAGAEVLHVDSGASANRTVITFAGTPKETLNSSIAMYRKASELIDMSVQHGVHPRMGAVDVHPFVPVKDCTMGECIALAKELGQQVSQELKIPVFLYEEAASTHERRALPYLRRGGYESLGTRLNTPEFKPDFGEARLNKKFGASVIGARDFLVAFNINLGTTEVSKAEWIARRLRESGYRKKAEYVPGALKQCRAIGWKIEEFGCAQVSCNLLNFRTTNLCHAYEKARALALEVGTEVRGSELIGLVPRKALLDCGRFYEGTTESTEELYRAAIEGMGLDSVKEFKVEERVLEERLGI